MTENCLLIHPAILHLSEQPPPPLNFLLYRLTTLSVPLTFSCYSLSLSLNLSLLLFLFSFNPFPFPLFSHSSLFLSNPSLIFLNLFLDPSIKPLLCPSSLVLWPPFASIHLPLIPPFFVHPRADPSSPVSFAQERFSLLLLLLTSPPLSFVFLPDSHLFFYIHSHPSLFSLLLI